MTAASARSYRRRLPDRHEIPVPGIVIRVPDRDEYRTPFTPPDTEAPLFDMFKRIPPGSFTDLR